MRTNLTRSWSAMLSAASLLTLAACGETVTGPTGSNLRSAPENASFVITPATPLDQRSGTIQGNTLPSVCPAASAFSATDNTGCTTSFNVAQNARWAIIPQTNWVSNIPDGSTDFSQPTEFIYYKYTFTLPAGFTAPSLTTDFYADNAAIVYLNGVEYTRNANQSDWYPNYGCIGTATVCNSFGPPQSGGTSSGFVVGTNVITYKVLNAAYATNPNCGNCLSATGIDFKTTVNYSTDVVAGDKGCSQGYFSNHTSPFDNVTVNSVFTNTGLANTVTMKTALDFHGGPTIQDAKNILLVQAAAAYLNIKNGVNYPINLTTLQNEVNAALASGDRATILAEASRLDAFNNLGCTLSLPNKNGR